MAAPLFLLLFLLPVLPPPARSARPGPGCRLQWVSALPGGPGRCRGGPVAACVGHCESGAFPSPLAVMAAARRTRTSRGTCCTMGGASKVHVTLRCPGGSQRRLPTVSAQKCRCDMCRLARF